MLQIIKETYGDKLSQAYTKKGLLIEESVVIKIIYNMLLKDQNSFNMYEFDYFDLWRMLENIQPKVLKMYGSCDAVKLENDCIIHTQAPGYFEFCEKMNKITDKLKGNVRFFWTINIGDNPEILILSPKKPLKKRKISNKTNLKPTTKEELKVLVNDESIYLGDIDTSLITDMGGLFAFSQRKDFSGINEWNTSKVANMSCMFFSCDSFNEELSFDTSCVVDMSFMFAESNFNNKLSFNTSNVRDMRGMFLNRNFNQKLDFDTSNVTNMSYMFDSCHNFNQELNFDTGNVEDMSSMFRCCENFNQPLNFDTSNVIDMSHMFDGCENFNQPLNFDTSNVSNMRLMFNGCKNFNQPLNFDTKNVVEMSYMFRDCRKFNQKLDFDISNIEYFDDMFADCESLKTLPKFYLDFKGEKNEKI